MCQLCYVAANRAAPSAHSPWMPRRAFLLAAGAAAATPVLGQVKVDEGSRFRNLIPAGELEAAAAQEYAQMMAQARQKGAVTPDGHPMLQRVRAIAARLIPQSAQWNDRARGWRWEVNVLRSEQVNAFVMPGGKMAVFAGLIDQLRATDDELAMVIGHEMAHALREHARARIAKTQGTGIGLSVLAQVLGLGQLGDVAANIGTQLITLRFSREDEIDADLVGLELAARSAFRPEASVTLWEKMGQLAGGQAGPAFLSTHPTGPDRLRRLRDNVPLVQDLYRQAVASGVRTPPARPPANAGIPILR